MNFNWTFNRALSRNAVFILFYSPLATLDNVGELIYCAFYNHLIDQ